MGRAQGRAERRDAIESPSIAVIATLKAGRDRRMFNVGQMNPLLFEETDVVHQLLLGRSMDYQRTLPALPHAALIDRILKVFFKTFEELGHGFLESVFSRAMQIALEEAGMEVLKEYELEVRFHGHRIGRCFADLIVDRTILIEVKGTSTIEAYAEAQVLNYLKMCGGGVGLLLNFGRRPQFKRFVMGDPTNSLPILKRDQHSKNAPVSGA